MKLSTIGILIRVSLIVVIGLLLVWSINGFLYYKSQIPDATDPTDGIGYSVILYAVFVMFSVGSLIGMLFSFSKRRVKSTESDPSEF